MQAQPSPFDAPGGGMQAQPSPFDAPDGGMQAQPLSLFGAPGGGMQAQPSPLFGVPGGGMQAQPLLSSFGVPGSGMQTQPSSFGVPTNAPDGGMQTRPPLSSFGGMRPSLSPFGAQDGGMQSLARPPPFHVPTDAGMQACNGTDVQFYFGSDENEEIYRVDSTHADSHDMHTVVHSYAAVDTYLDSEMTEMLATSLFVIECTPGHVKLSDYDEPTDADKTNQHTVVTQWVHRTAQLMQKRHAFADTCCRGCTADVTRTLVEDYARLHGLHSQTKEQDLENCDGFIAEHSLALTAFLGPFVHITTEYAFGEHPIPLAGNINGIWRSLANPTPTTGELLQATVDGTVHTLHIRAVRAVRGPSAANELANLEDCVSAKRCLMMRVGICSAQLVTNGGQLDNYWIDLDTCMFYHPSDVGTPIVVNDVVRTVNVPLAARAAAYALLAEGTAVHTMYMCELTGRAPLLGTRYSHPDAGTQVSLRDFAELPEDQQQTFTVFGGGAEPTEWDTFNRMEQAAILAGQLDAGVYVFKERKTITLEEFDDMHPTYQQDFDTFQVSTDAMGARSVHKLGLLDFPAEDGQKTKTVIRAKRFDKLRGHYSEFAFRELGLTNELTEYIEYPGGDKAQASTCVGLADLDIQYNAAVAAAKVIADCRDMIDVRQQQHDCIKKHEGWALFESNAPMQSSINQHTQFFETALAAKTADHRQPPHVLRVLAAAKHLVAEGAVGKLEVRVDGEWTRQTKKQLRNTLATTHLRTDLLSDIDIGPSHPRRQIDDDTDDDEAEAEAVMGEEATAVDEAEAEAVRLHKVNAVSTMLPKLTVIPRVATPVTRAGAAGLDSEARLRQRVAMAHKNNTIHTAVASHNIAASFIAKQAVDKAHRMALQSMDFPMMQEVQKTYVGLMNMFYQRGWPLAHAMYEARTAIRPAVNKFIETKHDQWKPRNTVYKDDCPCIWGHIGKEFDGKTVPEGLILPVLAVSGTEGIRVYYDDAEGKNRRTQCSRRVPATRQKGAIYNGQFYVLLPDTADAVTVVDTRIGWDIRQSKAIELRGGEHHIIPCASAQDTSVLVSCFLGYTDSDGNLHTGISDKSLFNQDTGVEFVVGSTRVPASCVTRGCRTYAQGQCCYLDGARYTVQTKLHKDHHHVWGYDVRADDSVTSAFIAITRLTPVPRMHTHTQQQWYQSLCCPNFEAIGSHTISALFNTGKFSCLTCGVARRFDFGAYEGRMRNWATCADVDQTCMPVSERKYHTRLQSGNNTALLQYYTSTAVRQETRYNGKNNENTPTALLLCIEASEPMLALTAKWNQTKTGDTLTDLVTVLADMLRPAQAFRVGNDYASDCNLSMFGVVETLFTAALQQDTAIRRRIKATEDNAARLDERLKANVRTIGALSDQEYNTHALATNVLWKQKQDAIDDMVKLVGDLTTVKAARKDAALRGIPTHSNDEESVSAMDDVMNSIFPPPMSQQGDDTIIVCSSCAGNSDDPYVYATHETVRKSGDVQHIGQHVMCLPCAKCSAVCYSAAPVAEEPTTAEYNPASNTYTFTAVPQVVNTSLLIHDVRRAQSEYRSPRNNQGSEYSGIWPYQVPGRIQENRRHTESCLVQVCVDMCTPSAGDTYSRDQESKRSTKKARVQYAENTENSAMTADSEYVGPRVEGKWLYRVTQSGSDTDTDNGRLYPIDVFTEQGGQDNVDTLNVRNVDFGFIRHHDYATSEPKTSMIRTARRTTQECDVLMQLLYTTPLTGELDTATFNDVATNSLRAEYTNTEEQLWKTFATSELGTSYYTKMAVIRANTTEGIFCRADNRVYKNTLTQSIFGSEGTSIIDKIKRDLEEQITVVYNEVVYIIDPNRWTETDCQIAHFAQQATGHNIMQDGIQHAADQQSMRSNAAALFRDNINAVRGAEHVSVCDIREIARRDVGSVWKGTDSRGESHEYRKAFLSEYVDSWVTAGNVRDCREKISDNDADSRPVYEVQDVICEGKDEYVVGTQKMKDKGFPPKLPFYLIAPLDTRLWEGILPGHKVHTEQETAVQATRVYTYLYYTAQEVFALHTKQTPEPTPNYGRCKSFLELLARMLAAMGFNRADAYGTDGDEDISDNANADEYTEQISHMVQDAMAGYTSPYAYDGIASDSASGDEDDGLEGSQVPASRMISRIIAFTWVHVFRAVYECYAYDMWQHRPRVDYAANVELLNDLVLFVNRANRWTGWMAFTPVLRAYLDETRESVGKTKVEFSDDLNPKTLEISHKDIAWLHQYQVRYIDDIAHIDSTLLDAAMVQRAADNAGHIFPRHVVRLHCETYASIATMHEVDPSDIKRLNKAYHRTEHDRDVGIHDVLQLGTVVDYPNKSAEHLLYDRDTIIGTRYYHCVFIAMGELKKGINYIEYASKVDAYNNATGNDYRVDVRLPDSNKVYVQTDTRHSLNRAEFNSDGIKQTEYIVFHTATIDGHPNYCYRWEQI